MPTNILPEAVSVLFLDLTVDNYIQLLAGVRPGIQLHVLDSTADGIEQITHILKAHYAGNFIREVHIVSHGSPGCLDLGNTPLSLATLPHYTKSLQAWFTATAENREQGIGNKEQEPPHDPRPITLPPSTPQLFLYGCNVAAGDAGEEFLTKLHRLTGATIHASTTKIGHAALGGNWELDAIASMNSLIVWARQEGNTPSDGPINAHPLASPISPFHSSTLATYPATLGTDGDGQPDATDIDDDNDGILDTAEQISGFGTGGTFGDGDTVPDGATVFTLGPDGPTPAVNVTTLGGTTTTSITWETNEFGNLATAPALADGLLFSFDNNSGTTQANIEIDFGQTVFDSQFTIGDIDGPTPNGESITVRAFDSDNNEITLDASNFQNVGSNINLTGTTISSEGGTTPNNSPDSSVQVVIPGAVSRVVLEAVDPAAGATGNLFFNLNGLAYTGDLDTDSDGVVNRLDIDSDNDGIPDNIEAQTTAGYIAPSGIGAGITDGNNDGLDDNYAGGLNPVNTDGTDEVDYLDADSDNDGIDDIAERGDGQPTSITSNADDDGDGLLNIFEDGTPNDGFDVNDSAIAGDNGGTDGDYSNFALADTDADTDADEPVAANRTSNNADPTNDADLDFRDISAVDPLPTAVDDTATVAEDDAFNISILGNDSFGGDGAGTSPITVTPPANGSAVINDGGTPTDPTDDTIDYTPNTGFTGTDSFTYTITDASGDTSTATVDVTVNPGVNDVPTAADDTATVAEDSTVNVPVLTNDTARSDER
ncbi:MAG: DUF4347 domain-containing protein, partial [Cyanobacteria bacterium J06636_16]